MYFKVLLMNESTSNVEALSEIKRMMERSSRFISLSGWSGIAAGICALAGAVIARYLLNDADSFGELKTNLMLLAALVFLASFTLAMFFTYTQSKKDGVPIWGSTARRLIWNTLLPMLAGAVVIFRLINLELFELLVPAALVFYGLALINGSKYTMGEVRFLGYAELLTGLISLWFPAYALIFWGIGFGIYHIIYGIAMWWKIDRN